jgi:aspartyl-tRNA(Asn)/glutamyl-tRNA(Gln) amidotransferase subunit B
MAEYEVNVGMECHAELLTESKMFCGCRNEFGGEPNTRTCPVCLGLPGSLPVFNGRAVEHVVRTALALNCEISFHTIFHRKNYFYPDLPKGYQISQYGDTPIGTNGYLEIEKADGTTKRIHITRVHLEEDTGKSIHSSHGGAVSSDGAGYSVMDYNRSGVPLMEIVTAFPPDVASAEEATLYAETLRSILLYLGASDGRMEQGSLRVEPNPSVRKVGSDTYGTKTELKNLNSFRSVQRGIDYEKARQSALLERGETVVQATFGWDDEKGVTVLQRLKEAEQEYRYFPEPDLIPIDFSPEYVEQARQALPELPLARKRRFKEQYGLSDADAAQLTSDRATADYFEQVARDGRDAKLAANWILGDLARLANAGALPVYATPVSTVALAEMLALIGAGTLTGKLAKALIEDMYASGKSPAALMAEQGLTLSGADEVAGIVAAIVAANPDVVAKIKAGADKSKGFLVGQIMKETRGRARPDDVNRLLEEALSKV